MDLDYFKMRAHFLEQEKENNVYFRLADLAQLWFCSKKQSKRRLLGYQALGKLHYLPGLGRGNQSQLTFSSRLQTEIQAVTKQALAENALEDVLALLELAIPRHWFDNFVNEIRWLFRTAKKEPQKNILRYIINREITSLDPIKAAVSREFFLVSQLGDTLVTYNKEKHCLEAGLAHHWQASADFCQWTFYLRKNVHFHHGRTLTSQDVAYTLERSAAQNSVLHWQLSLIERVDCLDDLCLQIQLKQGDPFFIRYLAMGNLAILPYDIPFQEQQWISTGAFKVKSFTGKRLVLEAFDDYYGQRALMDQIEFWKMSDTQLPATVLITDNEDIQEAEYVQRQREYVGAEFLIFNFHKHPLIHKKAFRQAIAQLMNIEKMQKALRLTHSHPATSYRSEFFRPIQRQPQKIASLLQEAGYRGETLAVGALKHRQALEQALWLAQEAQKYGIRLKVDKIAIEEDFYTDVCERNFDLLLLGDVPPADIEVGFLDFCSNPALFCQRYFSADILNSLDQKLTAMKRITDYAEREIAYREIDGWLTENYYLIYTLHPTKVEWVHSVIDRQNSDFSSYLSLKEAWVSTDSSPKPAVDSQTASIE